MDNDVSNQEIFLQWVSIIISLLTLIGSAFGFWMYNRRINKQNFKINQFILKEQREKEDDSKKAVIEVTNIYYGKGGGDVIISNSGMSDARNLQIYIDERKDSGIYWRCSGLFPYRCLTPGASIKFRYGLLSGFQKDPVLTFEWDDDFENKRTSRHSIFLG